MEARPGDVGPRQVAALSVPLVLFAGGCAGRAICVGWRRVPNQNVIKPDARQPFAPEIEDEIGDGFEINAPRPIASQVVERVWVYLNGRCNLAPSVRPARCYL
jgi:hypothetical protein